MGGAYEVEKQLGVWFVVGITNKQRSLHWVIRTRGIKFSGGHEENTWSEEK